MSALLLSVAFVATAPSASASSCTNYAYGGYKTQYFHNRGIEGDIQYEQNDFVLSSNDHDHADAYLDDHSQYDAGAANHENADWVQIGFVVGAADNAQSSTTKVYAETNGPNGGPDTYMYSYPWGNRYFTNEFVYQYAAAGRGLYYGWYSLNFNVLGHAYLIDPGDTAQQVANEGFQYFSSSYCPRNNGIEFGTTGSPNTWNSSTDIEIYNDVSQFVSFTPGNVARTPITSSPYSIDVWNDSNAFYTYGGG